MSGYAGVSMHRERLQITTVDHDGSERVNRNVPAGQV